MSNQKLIKNYLDNIKSIYILEGILDILEMKILFKMIQHNKKFQKRLGISIDDYKSFSKIVEIEIIPAKNKYGTIINIVNNEERAYFHIHINNCKKEINRTYITKDDNAKTIQIIIDESVKSFNDLFYLCNCIKSIKFKRFNRNDIESMKYMFYGCSSLKELDLSKMETHLVKNMMGMFSGCKSLKKLNLSKFYTGNVTNMKYMFFECISLEELNINSFDTSSVTDMSYMFSRCIKLKELRISHFKDYKLINNSFMFKECSEELIKKIESQHPRLVDKNYVFNLYFFNY